MLAETSGRRPVQIQHNCSDSNEEPRLSRSYHRRLSAIAREVFRRLGNFIDLLQGGRYPDVYSWGSIVHKLQIPPH